MRTCIFRPYPSLFGVLRSNVCWVVWGLGSALDTFMVTYIHRLGDIAVSVERHAYRH